MDSTGQTHPFEVLTVELMTCRLAHVCFFLCETCDSSFPQVKITRLWLSLQ